MAILLAILGAISIIYGITIWMIHSGTWFFAVWFAIGAAFLAAAWATQAGAWEAVPVLAKRIGAVLLVAIALAIAVTDGLMLTQFDSKGEDNLDYVIVLGAQVMPDGTPSAVLQYRLDAAYDYLQANSETLCIVSGGQGPNEVTSEAQCMAAYLESRGVDSSRIILEDRSLNTVQNITNSMAYFDVETARVGLVTNNFHMFRAKKLAEHAGVAHVSGIAAYSTEWYLPNNMLRESMGIIKDFACGNI